MIIKLAHFLTTGCFVVAVGFFLQFSCYKMHGLCAEDHTLGWLADTVFIKSLGVDLGQRERADFKDVAGSQVLKHCAPPRRPIPPNFPQTQPHLQVGSQLTTFLAEVAQ